MIYLRFDLRHTTKYCIVLQSGTCYNFSVIGSRIPKGGHANE